MQKKERTCPSVKQGFTLIELLIVIAIIGILAGVILVSTSSAKNKATASVTKQTISSLKSAMTVCCSNLGATLLTVPGSDVCDLDGAGLGIDTNLPVGTDLKLISGDPTYAVVADCDQEDPEMTITLTNHPLAACNAIWNLKVNGGLTVPAGC